MKILMRAAVKVGPIAATVYLPSCFGVFLPPSGQQLNNAGASGQLI